MKFDVHHHITAQIIQAMATPGKCQLPWHRSGLSISRPINVASQKPYNGGNVLTLWATADAASYQSGIWGTYRQWTALGAQVRGGEKSTMTIFYKSYHKDDGDKVMVAKGNPLFAAEQVDGYAIPQPVTPNVAQSILHADEFVANTQANIIHGGDRASYQPATDTIAMPNMAAFTSTEAYYAVLLHEVGHWTSASKRCNRPVSFDRKAPGYAFEELVAELTAAFLCADLQITNAPRDDHAQYLNTWIALLKADKRAIFRASSAASAAVAYLNSLQPKTVEIKEAA